MALISIREDYAPKLENKKNIHCVTEDRNLQSIKEHLQKIYESLEKQELYNLKILSIVDQLLVKVNLLEKNTDEEILSKLKCIEEKLNRISVDVSEISSSRNIPTEDFEHLLKKSKDEYISAIQCEMEICRTNIIKEFYRSCDRGLKGHGDPFCGM